MVPSGILLPYLVLVVFTIALVLVYLESQRQPQVNITIVCGGEATERALDEGIVNGSGLLIRCRERDLLNIGPELQKGLRIRLVPA